MAISGRGLTPSKPCKFSPEARVKKSLPITPKFKNASATTDSAKNRQSYLKSCYSIFKFASPHPKVISDFLYEEELLNLRIQAPVCSDTGGNDFLTPASVLKRYRSPVRANEALS
jgi:hypothetical protein